jgi:hypothetical protein
MMKRDLSSFTLRSTKYVQDDVALAVENIIVLFMKRKRAGGGVKELTQRERTLITLCNCYLIIA